MKKIIIAAALVLTTGVLSSQIKVNTVQPVSATVHPTVSMDNRKELASGD